MATASDAAPTDAIQEGDSSWLDAFSILDPKSYLEGFLTQNTRPDGRLFHRVRPTVIHKSIVTKNAVGSALVKLGKTQVLGAVSLQVGHPAATMPNEGDVAVMLTHKDNNNQQDSNTTISTWIQTLLQRHVVELSGLCIQEGKAAWRLVVVLQVLNLNGNLRDAAFLAAVAALSDARIPTIQWKNQKVEIVLQQEQQQTHVKLKEQIPVPLTIGLYKRNKEEPNDDSSPLLLVDPSPLEEDLLEGTITMVVTAQKEIVNVSYAGCTRLSSHELSKCAHLAFGRAREVTGLWDDP